ncbi:hypothetical protein A0V81_003865 [Salmonella enterica subsp. enterica serovar Newmexico]|nr:hypothetical protein [Salmonella enterica]EBP9562484.1 hypothetical protein [Salmonella enterica subsp. enterica]EDP9256871.1 hypothetical protein [Salmonella enterica subsp. enterica serovar Newmexico]EDX2437815.1 hypothetical protein [Salmonella enterica subsp. enterica serovar Koenigstuhl]EGI6214628.1 hypothetical protein [Salmonella enterica subsp. enterica serovar Denver]
MMKKKLIALALGAAAVSSSAMAWEANGLGGEVNFGGVVTINSISTKNPWEVFVGGKASGLDANVATGATVVKIPLSTSIPVLGIRTKDKAAFRGAVGITPQINYGGKVDLSSFNDGASTLTIDVNDSSNSKIGTMTAPIYAAAEVSVRDPNSSTGGFYRGLVLPKNAGDAFFGGLSTDDSGIPTHAGVAESILDSIEPAFSAHWDDQGLGITDNRWTDSFSPDKDFNAFYGSGIESGKTIVLNLDSAFNSSTVVQWKAQLPIVISYQ